MTVAGQTVSGQQVFDDLIERHGGIARFSAVQIQFARTITKMMFAMQSAEANQTGRIAGIAAAMTSLLDKLPPAISGDHRHRTNKLTADMTLHEMGQMYARMCADPSSADSWTTDDLAVADAPVIDGTVNPPVPATRAAAAGASRPAPSPSQVPDPPAAPAPTPLDDFQHATTDGPQPIAPEEMDLPPSPPDESALPPRPCDLDPRLAVFSYMHRRLDQWPAA